MCGVRCSHHYYRVVDVFSGKSCDDPTLLTTLLRQTELVGLMQLLYAILLSDGPPRHSQSPPTLPQHTLAIALATIKALNNCAILDLKMVQVIACIHLKWVMVVVDVLL